MCCGNPRSSHPPSTLHSFLTPVKGQCDRTSICNADHVRKEKRSRNQWSCINLLTANVLHILILDPFPAIPQTNRHCPLGPHLSSSILKDATLGQGKSTTPSFFEVRSSNCHLEMCLAGLGPQNNGLKREKNEKVGVWKS